MDDHPTNDERYWRDRAAEVRITAETVQSAEARAVLRRIEASYLGMADRAKSYALASTLDTSSPRKAVDE